MTVLTRAQVFSQSWPVIFANALTPLVGLVDTWVIGQFVGTSALAGIGLGAVIYGIIYWGFGFLRMSTAGLSAQSDGANDQIAVQSHLFRAVPLGLLIGLIMLALQIVIIPLAFLIFTADADIESSAAIYIKARLWGLPAYLALIALMGWFIGLGRAKRALSMQIALNLVNVSLSLLFVIKFKMGLHGVGLATALAEWGGLACGLLLALGEIRRRGGFIPDALTTSSLLKLSELTKLGQANTNIFIRTAALTFGFSFFGNAAASQGETFLAANHIHLQLITLSAFILDGFANTAEAVVGAAYGAKSRTRFDRAVRLTSEFSFGFALICGVLIYSFGGVIIDQLSTDIAVQTMARTYLPYCALAPVIGFAAYQLDGVFIGTTRTREMRNAGLAAVLIYLAIYFIWPGTPNGHGIWITFLIYYLARTITLLYYYSKIRPQDI